MSKLKPAEKKLVKLGIALVGTVILGVVLIVATLMGNSSEFEYDSETVQGEVRLDQEQQDVFAERRQRIVDRENFYDVNDSQGGVQITEVFNPAFELMWKLLEVTPLFIVLFAVAGIIAAMVKGWRNV